MPAITDRVTLTDEEVDTLDALWHQGKCAARQQTRARMLWKAAAGCPEAAILEALGVSARIVGHPRQRGVEEGLDAALHDRPGPGNAPTLTDQPCAHVIATACTAGYDHWPRRLLADPVVPLGSADTFRHASIRRRRKQTPENPGQCRSGVFPRSARSVWRRGQTCLTCLPSRMTRRVRSSASTQAPGR